MQISSQKSLQLIRFPRFIANRENLARTRRSLYFLALFLSPVAISAQTLNSQATPMAASAPTAIPALVPYSGIALGSKGEPLTAEASMTFLIYKDESGGEPLWSETQMATFDSAGHYKVQLGAANPNGLPSDLFSTGEARWLEVQIAGQPQQPRVLLASVPYAMKAADAATLGGLPASAYALAGTGSISPAAVGAVVTPNAVSNVTTTGGTADKLAKFSGTNTIVNSILYDNGTEVGIGTTTPSATLTVDGTMTIDGLTTLNGALLAAVGTATSAKGYDSQLFKFYASAYNSSSKAVVSPRFELQAEPTNNNTSAPGGTLNLLSSTTSATATETGFYINSNGTVHFAQGQTFDGVANALIGIIGTSNSGTGVNGTSKTGDGVNGTTVGNTLHTAGVYGIAGSANTSGFNGIAGVWGDSSNSAGVYGSSDQAYGVYGISNQQNGVQGYSNQLSGVYGETATSSPYYAGVYGSAGGQATGARGDADAGAGVYGQANAGDGVEGISYGGSGVYGIQGYSDSGLAGEFEGDVSVTGTITGAANNFKIDHPLDPANKYLVHASVESSENMNIYTGNVTTDELGVATVQLPAWFEAENGDFRYQLTVVDERFAQAVVSKRIANHQFTIHTNASNVQVSWQITAVRQDAYAKANPLVVEETKGTTERGFYLHPELYGQPMEKQTAWARHPETMRRAQAARDAQKSKLKSSLTATAQSQTAASR